MSEAQASELHPIAFELLQLGVAACEEPIARRELDRITTLLVTLDRRTFVTAGDDVLRVACVLEREAELAHHARGLRELVTAATRRVAARQGRTDALTRSAEHAKAKFHNFHGGATAPARPGRPARFNAPTIKAGSLLQPGVERPRICVADQAQARNRG